MMKVLLLVISHFLDPIVIFCMYFMNDSVLFMYFTHKSASSVSWL